MRKGVVSPLSFDAGLDLTPGLHPQLPGPGHEHTGLSGPVPAGASASSVEVQGQRLAEGTPGLDLGLCYDVLTPRAEDFV